MLGHVRSCYDMLRQVRTGLSRVGHIRSG